MLGQLGGPVYSVDGIALDNPALGWKLRAPSQPLSSHSADRYSASTPGIPGVLPDADHPLALLTPPSPTLVVETPRAQYSNLVSLLATGRSLSLTDVPGREAVFEFLSQSMEGFGNADAVIDVTAVLRIPGVFWRDTAVSTYRVVIGAASVTLDAWRMDGLVQDATVRVQGPFSGLRVASGPAAFAYTPAVPAGSYLRHELATGRSFITTSDTWTGGTEVSGSVAVEGPADGFAVFPTRTSAVDLVARLVATTATRGAGAAIEITGKGAYLV